MINGFLELAQVHWMFQAKVLYQQGMKFQKTRLFVLGVSTLHMLTVAAGITRCIPIIAPVRHTLLTRVD